MFIYRLKPFVWRASLIGVRLFVFALFVFGTCNSQTVNLYISPDGNDFWSGRSPIAAKDANDGPYASLDRVQAEVRRLRAGMHGSTDSITVWLRGGTYYLACPLTFTTQDSGTVQGSVIYRNYGNEHPVIAGGTPVNSFQMDRGGIYEADLSAQGMVGTEFWQLFYKGKRQILARYPNYDPQNPVGGGWAYVAGKWCSMYASISAENSQSKRQLPVKSGDFHVWKHPQDGQVVIFARFNYWNDVVPVADADPHSRRLLLANDCSYAIRPGDRYYVQNVREELDVPGEWFLDRRTQVLYFWPPDPMTVNSVVLARLPHLVVFKPGTQNITVQGLTLTMCVGNVVEMDHSTNCQIKACTIQEAGGYSGDAVHIEGGVSNAVAGCDIHDVGRDGIYLNGGEQATLTPAHNRADNNVIFQVGRDYKQGVGVEVHGVGNRLSHNLIFHTPRFGILFSGNRHILEYNHIHHVNLETQDGGAIYTGGRDWLGSYGCVIRYNYIHDSAGFGQAEDGRWQSPAYAFGISLDDNAGGVDIIGNIITRCAAGLIYLHNGRDADIENNILVDCPATQVYYSGWLATGREWQAFLPEMLKAYAKVADQPAWRSWSRFPGSPAHGVLPDGSIMQGNVFSRNIQIYSAAAPAPWSGSYFSLDYMRHMLHADLDARLWTLENVSLSHFQSDSNLVWHDGLPLVIREERVEDTGRGPVHDLDWAGWQAQGFDRHSLVADPLFVHANRDDYHLAPGSPAERIGFQSIPVDQIGPYYSPERASWPVSAKAAN